MVAQTRCMLTSTATRKLKCSSNASHPRSSGMTSCSRRRTRKIRRKERRSGEEPWKTERVRHFGTEWVHTLTCTRCMTVWRRKQENEGRFLLSIRPEHSRFVACPVTRRASIARRLTAEHSETSAARSLPEHQTVLCSGRVCCTRYLRGIDQHGHRSLLLLLLLLLLPLPLPLLPLPLLPLFT